MSSYKLFFKTCNFNIQILIQSKKEDLLNHFSKINQINEFESDKIKEIYSNYIDYINNLNKKNKSSSKNFYIILDFIYQKEFSNEIFPNESEKQIIINNLNDKYFKLKECLSRMNNLCIELNKDEVVKVLYSFFNKRKEVKY